MSDSYQDERFERMFLSRIPRSVAQSFDDEQLSAIKTVFGGERWDHHPVDIRGTLWLPFRRRYFVFLAGPERRNRKRAPLAAQRGTIRRALRTAFSAIVVIWLVALVLYLVIPASLLAQL